MEKHIEVTLNNYMNIYMRSDETRTWIVQELGVVETLNSINVNTLACFESLLRCCYRDMIVG